MGWSFTLYIIYIAIPHISNIVQKYTERKVNCGASVRESRKMSNLGNCNSHNIASYKLWTQIPHGFPRWLRNIAQFGSIHEKYAVRQTCSMWRGLLVDLLNNLSRTINFKAQTVWHLVLVFDRDLMYILFVFDTQTMQSQGENEKQT